jgi:hypothetical protein
MSRGAQRTTRQLTDQQLAQQSLGASNTTFDALRECAANRTAATNNSAGYGDLTAQLASN